MIAERSTRCLHPIAYYELAGRPRGDVFPECWRPRGHPDPGRHLSRLAVEHEAERKRRRRQRRQRQELAA